MQPTHAQSTSRIRKPTLDEMGPGTDRPIPVARAPNIDPRAKAGAFGEAVRGPHKPTLDEMGPHASLSIPNAGTPALCAPSTCRRRPKRKPAAAVPAKLAGRGGSGRNVSAPEMQTLIAVLTDWEWDGQERRASTFALNARWI